MQVSFVRSEQFPGFRGTLIAMVMGTDMKKHFDIMSRFQVSLPSDPLFYGSAFLDLLTCTEIADCLDCT